MGNIRSSVGTVAIGPQIYSILKTMPIVTKCVRHGALKMTYIPITRRFEAQIKVLGSNYLSTSSIFLKLWSMAKENVSSNN